MRTIRHFFLILFLTVMMFMTTQSYAARADNPFLEAPCYHPSTTVPVDECLILLEIYNYYGGFPAYTGYFRWFRPDEDADGNIYYNARNWQGITWSNDDYVVGLEFYYESDFDIDMSISSLSPSIAKLSHLQSLRAGSGLLQSQHKQLAGSIPDWLGNINSLEYLNLSWNKLSGEIPASIADLSGLKTLILEYNNLSGPIPGFLGDMSSLETLDLSTNNFSGELPTSLGNLSNLKSIGVNHTYISGTFPDSFGNLNNLTFFQANCTRMSGTLPMSLTNLTNLQYFYYDGFLGELQKPSAPAFQAWLDSVPNVIDHPSCYPTLAINSTVAGQYFVAGASIANQYEVLISRSDANEVTFSLNKETTTVPLVNASASTSYNIGSDLVYDVTGQVNTLNVEALENGLPAGLEQSLELIGILPPAWLPGAFSIEHDTEGGWLTYLWELQYPDPPFEGKVTPPNWIPLVGGSPLGIKETQADLSVEVTSVGFGNATVAGETGFEIGDQEITGVITGTGLASIHSGLGIQLDSANMSFEINGHIEQEAPFVDVLCKAVSAGTCPLRQAESWAVIGNIIRQINQSATLTGSIEPTIEGDAAFKSVDDELAWQASELYGRLKSQLTLAVELYHLISASVTGGGDSDVTFQFPANPNYVKAMNTKLLANATFDALAFSCNFDAAYGWSYPDDAGVQWISEAGGTCEQTIPFLATEETDIFNNPFLNKNTGQTTSETTLLSNVIPEAKPTLTLLDDMPFVVWTHFDSNKPAMQQYELQYTRYDGESWTSPALITDDTLLDINPQIAVDNNGQVIAVWVRNKVQQSAATTLNATYVNNFELAYAVWNGTAWSTPAYLTNNSVFDHAPILARSPEGQLIVVWRQNAQGQLLGDNTSPDTLMSALWNGTSWEAPQTIVSNLGGLLSYSVAIFGNTQTIVFSQDTDADYTTGQDEELFRVDWNGTSWSIPAQLTNNAISDLSPSLLYVENGMPELLWIQGDQLVGLMGNLSGSPVMVLDEPSVSIRDFRMVQDLNGNLSLFWQTYSDEGGDIFYATYDESPELFSHKLQLTHDSSLEKYFSPAIDSSGMLHMAYNETDLISETVTISPTFSVSGVTTFGQTDLNYLTHTFGPDLTFAEHGLSTNAAQNTQSKLIEITALIKNAGDMTLFSPTIHFYLGNPNSGGQLIGSQALTSNLPGGGTSSIVFNWQAPTQGSFTIYAVGDPENTIVELDENNNTAVVTFTIHINSYTAYLPVMIR